MIAALQAQSVLPLIPQRMASFIADKTVAGSVTLIAHGDDDQIVPIVAAGEKSSKIVKGSTYKVYPGAPHGLAMVPKFAEQFNADLLDFARG